MKNNNYLVFSMIFLIVVLAIQIVSSAEGPYGWEYDEDGEVVEGGGIDLSDPEYLKVVEALNEFEWIKVIIGVVSEEVREEVISLFSETEFKSLRRWPVGDSFSGQITKFGLDKLINNTNVKWINLDEPLTTASNNEPTDNPIQNEDKAQEEQIGLKWLWIIIGIVIVILTLYLIFKKKK